MRILERPERWNVEIHCLHCKSKLLVEEEDVRFDDRSEISKGRTTPFFFYCPVCKANNPLGNVPAHVQESVAAPYKLIR